MSKQTSRVLKNGTHRVTQGYTAAHRAVDLGPIRLPEPVIAHTAGTVVFCQTGQKNSRGSTGNKSYGNCVKLDHGDGWATLYAHLDTVTVKKGDSVKQGQVLGTMGNTGNSTGTHLHFEVRRGSERQDPLPYLNAALPAPTPQVTYRAYAGQWWPFVTGCHDRDSSGYAGVTGRNMTALQAACTVGRLTYRVHRAGGGWLPWVNGGRGWAGNRRAAIDGVQMKLEGVEGYQVRYRVSVKGRWLNWCTGLTDPTGDGYAGNLGSPLDRIQIQIVQTV